MKLHQMLMIGLTCAAVGCDESREIDGSGDKSLAGGRFFHFTGAKSDGKDNAVAAAAPAGRKAKAKPAAADSTVLRVKPVTIYDSQGWGRPIVARVMLAPSKWKVEGHVQWRQRAFKGEEIQERFAITRPDGLVRLEKVPQFRWGWSNSMNGLNDLRSFGTRVARIGTVEEAVKKLVLPTMRSKDKARLVSITPNEKLSRTATQAVQKSFSRSPTLSEHRVKAEVVTATVSYQVNGTECEEHLLLQFISIRQPVVNIQLRQLIPGAHGQGIIDSHFLEGFAFRTPKGEMKKHELLLTTMLASARQNPGWIQAVARHRHKMNQIRLKGMWNRHQIRMNANREIAAMQHWSWKNRQASNDRQAAQFSRTIREVELFHDPVLGRNIELGAGYRFVYRNNNDEYLLFNNPLFDPNVELNGEWQKLRRVDSP